MSEHETLLSNLIKKLKRNLKDFEASEKNFLSQVRPPKLPGVYMLFFEAKLQYIGSSGNLHKRLRTNLLSGDRESHTLINKLCELRKLDVTSVLSFLKSNSNVKILATETEDDAKILEDFLIAIYHPFYNVPLRKLKELK
jgi:excinuclease UvrABC nuclease subunit